MVTGLRQLTSDVEERSFVAGTAMLTHIAAMLVDQPDFDAVRLKVMEGIARGVLLTARYNGQALTLAPHALLSRRGELFVSALNVAKNWRSDDERRLGLFKLSGLAEVELNDESFEALPPSAAPELRSDDELILAIA